MIRQRSTRVVGAAIVTAVVGLGAVQSPGPLESGRPTEAAPPLLYSYFSDSELVVMRGRDVVARKTMSYQPELRGAVWTLNARYVVALADNRSPDENPDPEQRKLVVVDVSSGSIQERACPNCGGVAPVGDNIVLVAVLQDPEDNRNFDGVLRFDLADPKPPVRLPPISLPEPGAVPSRVLMLAGVEGQALVLGLDLQKQAVYYLYRPDGSFTTLNASPSADAAEYITESAGVKTPDGGVTFATANHVRSEDNECATEGNVKLWSAGSRATIVTDLSPLTPAGREVGKDAFVIARDIWWESSGELHAVLWAGTCND